MLTLLIKEEARLYKKLFGFNIFVLSIVIFLMSLGISFVFIPMIKYSLTKINITLDMIYYIMFLFFGLNFGIFSVFYKEIISNKINDVNFIYNINDILPLKRSTVFSFVTIKEIFFTILLILFPFILGLNISFALIEKIKIDLIGIILFFKINFIALTLYFFGFALSFLIGMLYHLSIKQMTKYLILIFLLFSILIICFKMNFNVIILSCVTLIIAFILLLIGLGVSDEAKDEYKIYRKYENTMSNTKNPLNTLFINSFIRSGLMFKMIFSYVFSIILVIILTKIFVNYFLGLNFLIILAIFLALFSPSFYNWLTQYSEKGVIDILPINEQNIMKELINLTNFLNSINIIILILISLIIKSSSYDLILSIFTFFSFSFFNLIILAKLTGIYAYVKFYNWKIFSQYLLITLIPIIIALILMVLNKILLTIFILFLLILSHYLFKIFIISQQNQNF